MTYAACMESTGLYTKLEVRYGQWGHVDEHDVADCLEAAAILYSSYLTPGQQAKTTIVEIAAALLFTMANESAFHLDVMPNNNGHIEDPERKDYGPEQVNAYWYHRAVAKGIIKDVTAWEGTAIAGKDVPFDGDPIKNMVAAGEMLFAYHGSLEEQVVHYTGPDHQERRREDWRVFGPLMIAFYNCYGVLK